MAANENYSPAKQLQWKVGTGKLTGQPVMLGFVPGVCLETADANGLAPVKHQGVFSLSVKGVAASAANTAINVGDKIYLIAGDTPVLCVDPTGGFLFGYAYSETIAPGSQAVASGATTTIEVLLAQV